MAKSVAAPPRGESYQLVVDSDYSNVLPALHVEPVRLDQPAERDEGFGRVLCGEGVR